MASKTGGGKGTNQHAVKGRSKSAAIAQPSTASTTAVKSAAAAGTAPPATEPQVQFLDALHTRIGERLERIDESANDGDSTKVAALYADWHAQGVSGSKADASAAIEKLKQADSMLAGIEERNAAKKAEKDAAEASVRERFPDAPAGWTNPYRMPMTCGCGEPEFTDAGPGRFSPCADGCCFQCGACGAAC